MNRQYKTVFNHTLGLWQVVSELAKSRGKSGASKSSPSRQAGAISFRRKAGMGALVLAMLPFAGQGWAQSVVTGGEVIANNATIVPGPQITPWNIGGDLTVGNIGNGTLDISGGGSVSNVFGYIGNSATGDGTVTVKDAGSTWTNSDELIVGNFGKGKLTIENGGNVSSDSGTIGSAQGAIGEVTVTGASLGASSKWAIADSLAIADEGSGTLNILNGGRVESGLGLIGNDDKGNGTVTVDSGGIWTSSDDIVVGDFGAGTLNIKGGGNVSSVNGVVGNGSNLVTGNGAVTVSEAGSTWTNSGDLTVGNYGNGTLNIIDNGLVSAASVDVGVNGGQGLINLNNGTLDAPVVMVNGNGTLSGAGTVAGNVTINNGGTLKGAAGGTLTMGNVTLNNGAIIDAAFGATTDAALFKTNALNVAGSTSVNVSNANAGAFGDGLYALIDYTTLTGFNNLVIGSNTTGSSSAFTLQNDNLNTQINLLVGAASATSYNYWHNGSGTWNAANTNWSNFDNTQTGAYDPTAQLFFTGAGGTVAVDGGGNPLSIGPGIQFFTDGYTVQGDGLALTEPTTTFRVGDGTAAGAAITATIASDISGSGDVVKTDYGKLILTGANTYTGATNINAGTLALSGSSWDTIASSSGVNVASGATLEVSGYVYQDIKSLSGAGNVNLLSTLRLTDASGTFSGQISNAFLEVIGGTQTLTGAGSSFFGFEVYGNATLKITNGGTVSVAGAYLGSPSTNGDGTVVVDGSGSTLTVTNTFSIGNAGWPNPGTVMIANGGTVTSTNAVQVDNGTLYIGNGGSAPGTLNAPSVALNSATNSVLRFNHNSAGYNFSPTITGAGAVVVDNGLTTLSGVHSYTGVTNINGGTLKVDGSIASSSLTTVKSGGALAGNGAVGDTKVENGGRLKGVSGSTLTLGDLMLESGAIIDAAFGSPTTASALFDVDALTINGATLVNVSNANAGAFGDGLYGFIDYGTLSGNLLDLTAINTTGSTSAFTFQNDNVNTQINLAVGDTNALNYWDGADTVGNGTMDGGAGDWSVSNANWTNAAGSANGVYDQTAKLVFAGSSGAVSVNSNVSFKGVQFFTDGYTVNNGGGNIVLNDATEFQVGQGNTTSAVTATINAVIEGAGGIVKTDLGTLELKGANTYSGGTAINGGVVAITSNANLGDASGALSFDGGTLRSAPLGVFASITMNRAITLNAGGGTIEAAAGGLYLTGVIDGVGALTKTGASIMLLEAANTYSGGTIINDGTIQMGVNGTLGTGALTVNAGMLELFGTNQTVGSLSGAGGEITNNGSGTNTFTVNQTVAGDYKGVISDGSFNPGFTALTKTGAATLTLTGINTYTGATNVDAGTLKVDGSIASSSLTTVKSGARLAGNGTVGDVTFQSGSFYEVGFDPTGPVSTIKSTGTATLGGATVFVQAGGAVSSYTPGTQYTILSANNVSGTFNPTVSSNLAFLNPLLDYDAQNVFLTLVRNNVSFASVGGTPNQRAAASGIQNLAGLIPTRIVGLSAEQARTAYDQLSGEIHASARTALIEDSRFVREAALGQLRAARGPENHLWSRAFGSWGRTDGDGNAARLERDTGGLFIGADGQITDNIRLGILGGYSRSDFKASKRGSSGEADNYHLGLYAGAQAGDLAFRAGGAWTWHTLSTRRNVAFAGFNDRLKKDYNASTMQVFAELGYGIDVGAARIEPFANLAYASVHTDSFTEKGNAAALKAKGETTGVTFSTLGAHISANVGSAAKLVGTLGWRHAFGDRTPESNLRFASGGNAFDIAGVPIARNAAVVDAGLDFAVSKNATLGISYNGQFGSSLRDNGVRAVLNVKF
ncbi:MAG: autotransporter domain-containing protein [Zoogloeaceae bacterium]|jgi:outer membrane autotransporter protein|nr:autotransporter domain-containing protein [Zoogloeaceae bacterium]